jgi:hypothetical protein
MTLRRVAAARYVVPLREGGSLPGVIEGDDGRLWVGKFRGAGQGVAALIAEVIAGELARAAGFAVPELAVLELPAGFGKSDGDPEIHDLLVASAGENLAVAFLSGALGFEPGVDSIDRELAARIVAFDVLVSNVDRTVKNPNLLVAGGRVWLIDHGAALYWQHAWDGGTAGATAPLPRLTEHALWPVAEDLVAAGRAVASALDDAALAAAAGAVPAGWLAAAAPDGGAEARRAAYAARLAMRRDGLIALLEAARG